MSSTTLLLLISCSHSQHEGLVLVSTSAGSSELARRSLACSSRRQRRDAGLASRGAGFTAEQQPQQQQYLLEEALMESHRLLGWGGAMDRFVCQNILQVSQQLFDAQGLTLLRKVWGALRFLPSLLPRWL